ncbi:MAG TPA: phosphoribosylanthranilate isomerase [Candidatus Omnitrophota bacterium]|nr:phosphoribosylanthranilate isomerase [Candidatus Omnitrophota bacterium]
MDMSMERVQVKVCGITNQADALACVEAGADALGFNFYRKSPRYISPVQAAQIVNSLPRKVITVGVFVNAQAPTVKKIARFCHLDMVQLHGNESPEFIERLKNLRVIKSVRVKNEATLAVLKNYHSFAFLFDSFSKKAPGGTGEAFDWKLIKHSGDIHCLIFLSGGLNERNVREAISQVRPDWVDVCSSLESSPGKKDYMKVKRFIATVNKYEKSSR